MDSISLFKEIAAIADKARADQREATSRAAYGWRFLGLPEPTAEDAAAAKRHDAAVRDASERIDALLVKMRAAIKAEAEGHPDGVAFAIAHDATMADAEAIGAHVRAWAGRA